MLASHADVLRRCQETQIPRIFFKKDFPFFKKKIYIVNSSQFLSPSVLWSCNVHKQQPKRSDIFILCGLSVKITGDTFITLDGEFFTEEIEDTESLYIMLLKLKSVLCPPDATAINQ